MPRIQGWVNNNDFFTNALARLRSERRYRVFADLERIAGRFPHAIWHSSQGPEERRDLVLNDYLGMGPASEGDGRHGRGGDADWELAPAAPAISSATIIP